MRERHPQWRKVMAGTICTKAFSPRQIRRNKICFADRHYFPIIIWAASTRSRRTGSSSLLPTAGSQLPHIVFSSPNVIFVVGTQKIVPSLEDAFKRLNEYVIRLKTIA